MVSRNLRDESGSLEAEPGSMSWAVAVKQEAYNALADLKSDGKRFKGWADLLDQYEGYKWFHNQIGAPFTSVQEFIETPRPYGLGADLQTVNQTLEKQDVEPINLQQWGGDRKSQEHQNQGSHDYLDIGRGTDYRIARLQRDRPDILEGLKEGQYRSVRQAAIAAGIVKDRPTVTVPLDDPAKAAAMLKQRLTGADLEILLTALQNGD